MLPKAWTPGTNGAVDGDAILSIRGDKDDPFSRGYLCPKGVALEDVHHDPDRITTPLRREGERWIEASWEEALEAAEGVDEGDHGRVVALGVFLLLWMVDSLGALLPDPYDQIVTNASLLAHFTPFATGALYLSDLGFFIALTLFGLFLSLRSLERR